MLSSSRIVLPSAIRLSKCHTGLCFFLYFSMLSPWVIFVCNGVWKKIQNFVF